MDVQNRWECAKFCFRCLGEDHQGQFCNRTRVCEIKEVLHRLLHSNSIRLSSTTNDQTHKIVSKVTEEMQSPRPRETKVGESGARSEGKRKEEDSAFTTVITKKGTSGTIAIPVFKNRVKRILVNVLIDDASTDFAADLGLQA